MTTMRSFRLPEAQLDQLKELASQRHENNQTQALLEAIDRYYQALHQPDLKGYVRLDRVNSGVSTRCEDCGRPGVEPHWLAVYSNGTVRAAVCDDCAQMGTGAD